MARLSLYYVDEECINGGDFLQFDLNTRMVNYGVYCTNLNYPNLEAYLLHIQCAITYSDGTQDFYSSTQRPFININITHTFRDSVSTASGKTIVSFDAEFQVAYGLDTLWEGRIYEEYTQGINA